MKRMIGTTLTAIGFTFALAGAASANPLNPTDFASIGALPGGNITIDTDTLTVNGNAGGVLQAQSGGPSIAVFAFDGGALLASGNSITVTGHNPLALLFRGSASIHGTIDVSGGNGTDGGAGFVGIGGAGVAGGGDGQTANPFDAVTMGGGPGAGLEGSTSGSGSNWGPGSGAGFGTDGGAAGGGVTSRAGGSAYGDPLSDVLQGGSGGGAGGGGNITVQVYGAGGGGGGGALEIGALTLLEFLDADILANGGDGGSLNLGGGGGSGGGILLHAFDVSIDVSTFITANGGDGGGPINGGGCGGAGRIEILTNTQGSLGNLGTVEAVAGTNNPACVTDNIVSFAMAADIGQAPTTQPPVASLPEPGSLALFGVGLAGLSVLRRRRKG